MRLKEAVEILLDFYGVEVIDGEAQSAKVVLPQTIPHAVWIAWNTLARKAQSSTPIPLPPKA